MMLLMPLLFAGCGDPVVVIETLTVINVAPSHGAANIGLDTTLMATFNDDLVDGSWAGAMYLDDASGNPVVSTLTYDASTRTLSIDPTEDLERDTSYSLVMTTSLEGQRLGPLPGEIWTSFQTLSSSVGAVNKAPVAVILDEGDPCQAGVEMPLYEDSYDPDGDALAYTWRVVDGPGGEISGAETDQAIFTAPVEGDYVIGLVVNDGTIDSSEAFLTIGCGYDDTGA